MDTRQDASRESDDTRRANPLGAYVTTVGALIFLVSVWLDWVNFGGGDKEANSASGYEADGVIPLLGYLGVGFALALLYATKRADRRQHRGLSLASFAVGTAAFLWALSMLIDAISTNQYNENVATSSGPWVALIGALLWAVGSFLLAKEPEGDREHDTRIARPVTHTETHPATPAHHTTGHDVHPTGHDAHRSDHTTGHDVRPSGYGTGSTGSTGATGTGGAMGSGTTGGDHGVGGSGTTRP